MIRNEDIEALRQLEELLEEEQGTIDLMLTFSRMGLRERPLTSLLALHADIEASWQVEELAAELEQLLNGIEESVQSGYSADWEPEAWARFRDRVEAARRVVERWSC